MQLAAIYGSVSASDGLLSDMGTLCDVLGSNGISDDLSELTGYAGNTLDNLNDLENTAYSILSQTETLLSQIQTLDSTVNSYVPELKTTLSDTKDLIGSLNTTVGDTHGTKRRHPHSGRRYADSDLFRQTGNGGNQGIDRTVSRVIRNFSNSSNIG